jgi:hypothetical protein
MVVGGQYFRSLAMWQCGESFNHMIAHEKPSHHRLMTSGLYQYLRHPSYFGWFYWSIGMQLVLGNFWCFAAYFYVSWKFFHERIPYEEELLLRFYGDEYRQYVARSYIGIPFVFSKITAPTPAPSASRSTTTMATATATVAAVTAAATATAAAAAPTVVEPDRPAATAVPTEEPLAAAPPLHSTDDAAVAADATAEDVASPTLIDDDDEDLYDSARQSAAPSASSSAKQKDE